MERNEQIEKLRLTLRAIIRGMSAIVRDWDGNMNSYDFRVKLAKELDEEHSSLDERPFYHGQ
jgi:hypothetical protein